MCASEAGPLDPLLRQEGSCGSIRKLRAEAGFGFLSGARFEGVPGAGIEAGEAGTLQAPAMLESRRGAIRLVQDPRKESAPCLSRRSLAG